MMLVDPPTPKDIVRGAVVLAVAALDAYVIDVFTEKLTTYLKAFTPDDSLVQLLPGSTRERRAHSSSRSELAACEEVVVADTCGSKFMLAMLNDLAIQTQYRLRWICEPDLVAEFVPLCHSPMAPLGHYFAADVTRKLFGLEPFSRVVARRPEIHDA